MGAAQSRCDADCQGAGKAADKLASHPIDCGASVASSVMSIADLNEFGVNSSGLSCRSMDLSRIPEISVVKALVTPAANVCEPLVMPPAVPAAHVSEATAMSASIQDPNANEAVVIAAAASETVSQVPAKPAAAVCEAPLMAPVAVSEPIPVPNKVDNVENESLHEIADADAVAPLEDLQGCDFTAAIEVPVITTKLAGQALVKASEPMPALESVAIASLDLSKKQRNDSSPLALSVDTAISTPTNSTPLVRLQQTVTDSGRVVVNLVTDGAPKELNKTPSATSENSPHDSIVSVPKFRGPVKEGKESDKQLTKVAATVSPSHPEATEEVEGEVVKTSPRPFLRNLSNRSMRMMNSMKRAVACGADVPSRKSFGAEDRKPSAIIRWLSSRRA